MQMQFFYLWRKCPFIGMKMQSLFMMMLVHAFKLWCKCLLTEMEMRMSFDGYIMMQMSLRRNAMTQMFWPRHKLFKNPVYFQNEVSLALENPKYFQNLIYYSRKGHLFFKIPKNWWSLLEIPQMGRRFEIRWFDSKDLSSQIGWEKGWHI